MRNNSKGFTLIELLAVIVILAIIALITTPVILNVIENSRKNAAVDKAFGTIDAVRVAYAQAQTGITAVGVPYTVNFGSDAGSGTNTATGGGWGTKKVGDVNVTASGDMPTEGWITIKSDGSIIAHQLKYGQYYCSTITSTTDKTFNSNNVVCSRTQSDVTVASIEEGVDRVTR